MPPKSRDFVRKDGAGDNYVYGTMDHHELGEEWYGGVARKAINAKDKMGWSRKSSVLYQVMGPTVVAEVATMVLQERDRVVRGRWGAGQISDQFFARLGYLIEAEPDRLPFFEREITRALNVSIATALNANAQDAYSVLNRNREGDFYIHGAQWSSPNIEGLFHVDAHNERYEPSGPRRVPLEGSSTFTSGANAAFHSSIAPQTPPLPYASSEAYPLPQAVGPGPMTATSGWHPRCAVVPSFPDGACPVYPSLSADGSQPNAGNALGVPASPIQPRGGNYGVCIPGPRIAPGFGSGSSNPTTHEALNIRPIFTTADMPTSEPDAGVLLRSQGGLGDNIGSPGQAGGLQATIDPLGDDSDLPGPSSSHGHAHVSPAGSGLEPTVSAEEVDWVALLGDEVPGGSVLTPSNADQ